MAEYKKSIINNTNYPAQVSLLMRHSDDLTLVAEQLDITVPPKTTQVVTLPSYGSLPFVNGVIAELSDRHAVHTIVRRKGDANDDLLNTHDTLTIALELDKATLTGSNH